MGTSKLIMVVTLQWTSIPANGGVYRKQDNLWLDGPHGHHQGPPKFSKEKS